MTRSYVLISPCRDEAAFMRQTLDSVLAQTIRPAKWVIVDDGSTDETPSILAEYASRHDWIEIVTRSNRGRRAVGAGVVEAFYAGLVSFLLNIFGIPVGYLHNSSLLSIGIRLVIVVIASLNLVLDFDFIEQGAAAGVPRYMEWYAAFGLIVTLVWLYLEILRLLTKIAGRR